jgi:uridine kinase
MYEGDGSTNRLTKFTDVRLVRRMLRDVQHRNHSPLSTMLHWHYVRAGELFSIVPLMGLADHIVNGGLPFDLAALKPFFTGTDGYLPPAETFAPYGGFLDARIRYDRVKRLLESVEGFSREQVASYDVIPGDSVIREFVGKSTVKIPHNE